MLLPKPDITCVMLNTQAEARGAKVADVWLLTIAAMPLRIKAGAIRLLRYAVVE